VARRAGTRLRRTRDSLPIWSCSVWGLPCPLHYCDGGALLPHLFTLTAMLPPRRYVFCGTFRQPGLNPASRTLSGTLLCGVRTFLPSYDERPSGPAANLLIIWEAAVRRQTSNLGTMTAERTGAKMKGMDIWLLSLVVQHSYFNRLSPTSTLNTFPVKGSVANVLSTVCPSRKSRLRSDRN
jgi:hypothetical protein